MLESMWMGAAAECLELYGDMLEELEQDLSEEEKMPLLDEN